MNAILVDECNFWSLLISNIDCCLHFFGNSHQHFLSCNIFIYLVFRKVYRHTSYVMFMYFFRQTCAFRNCLWCILYTHHKWNICHVFSELSMVSHRRMQCIYECFSFFFVLEGAEGGAERQTNAWTARTHGTFCSLKHIIRHTYVQHMCSISCTRWNLPAQINASFIVSSEKRFSLTDPVVAPLSDNISHLRLAVALYICTKYVTYMFYVLWITCVPNVAFARVDSWSNDQNILRNNWSHWRESKYDVFQIAS